MSLQYRAVGWNRQKIVYDLTLAGTVVLYLAAFVAANLAFQPDGTIETILIRGLATCAFVLLHVVLAIGPLARLDARFLPLLYNRRHLGVTMFLVALAHGAFATIQFHAGGVLNPMVSLFTSNGRYESLSDFPFQPLGFFALVILLLMASTSHDFWLANLTAPTWKRLHMMVYVAYALLIGHVTLGVLQDETSPWLAGLTGTGLVALVALHLAAAMKERSWDAESTRIPDGWIDAGPAAEIGEKRARVVCGGGERIAIFRYDGKISAVSNVCQHQNGPLGEGRIIDGCITCPWHGYQYLPGNGASPPPFTEKLPTFDVKVADGRVFVNPAPNRPGTRVEPAMLEGGA